MGSVKNLKGQNLNNEALPMLLYGSPDCSIDRTFLYTFSFPIKSTKPSHADRTYRNPIYLAKDYKKMIDLGEVRNQSELAQKKAFQEPG